jgi:hypothetical protein
MFRPLQLPFAVAATFYGLIGQAAPTVPFGPPPFQVSVGAGDTLTGSGSPAVRITAPIDGVRADTPIATSPEHASGSSGLLSLDATSEGASEPSVYAMILAGFGMTGFIVIRYFRTP